VTLLPALPDVADLAALLLRATLLIGAAWAAAAALRRLEASAAARHIAWLLGIAALLALPVLWWLAPDLRLPILPAEATTATASAAPASAGPERVLPGMPDQAGWSLILAIAYAAGAAALLLRLVVGRRMLGRLWRDSDADPAWDGLLRRLSSEMGLARPPELRISRGPAVPMTWGTLAPKLLLPAEASEWPPERRRLVLLHELAHVVRRDSLSRSLASLVCALYWIHPGAWLAARRMRMEQEHAADDRVLTAGGSPRAYALSLLDLASGRGASPRFDQAAAMAGLYQLERRLLSITGSARRKSPGALFVSSSALLAGVTTLLVAAGVPVRASPALPGPFGADRPEVAPAAGEGADPAGSEAPSPGRSERASAPPARPANGIGRIARQSAAASPPRRDAAAQEVGEVAPPPGDAPPLQDYGWELPRREPRVQTGAGAGSTQPDRITLPTYPDSSDRSGPSRWARNVPRLVRGRPPTGSPVSAQGPLELSWSIEVGGK